MNDTPRLTKRDDVKRLSAPRSSSRHSNRTLSHENIEHHNAIHFPKLSTDSESPDDGHVTIEAVQPPSSSSCSCSEDTAPELAGSTEQTPLSTTETDSPRPGHVRFRPRVRITSGINRHRHSRYSTTGLGRISLSRESSPDSSRSSSISAPLRSRSDDESNKPGWGPLGQRVALLSYNSPRRWSKDRRRRKRQARPLDERTSLLGSAFRAPYSEGGPTYDDYMSDSDQEEEARIAHEIDKTFGTWPGRVLNPHVRHAPHFSSDILSSSISVVVVAD